MHEHEYVYLHTCTLTTLPLPFSTCFSLTLFAVCFEEFLHGRYITLIYSP